jgi:hypothetical protein
LSTRALRGNNANYATLEAQIVDITNQRNNIAGQMIAILENSLFNGAPVDVKTANQLIEQSEKLLASFD